MIKVRLFVIKTKVILTFNDLYFVD